MRTIYRFEIPVDDRSYSFDLTPGSIGEPVAVAVTASSRIVEFWAVVDTENTTRRSFRVVGTGHPLPLTARYVGTAPRTPSGLVWHLVEV